VPLTELPARAAGDAEREEEVDSDREEFVGLTMSEGATGRSGVSRPSHPRSYSAGRIGERLTWSLLLDRYANRYWIIVAHRTICMAMGTCDAAVAGTLRSGGHGHKTV
jgi:hypothetical protein